MYLNTKMVGDDIVLKRRDDLYFGYNQSKIAEQVSRVTEEFLPIIDESLQKNAEWMVPLEMQPYLDTDLHSLYGEYLKDTQFRYQKRAVSTEFDHKRNAVHPMCSKYEISGEKVIDKDTGYSFPMCQVIIRLDEFDNRVSSDVYCAHFTGDVDIKDESGENRYNIYDFAAKDLGGKLQYTWELRIGTENHNMCVEYDKKTDTTRIVAERMDAEDNLIRKFSMGTFDTEELHTQLEFVLGDIVMEHNAKQHAEASELLEALGIDMNELEM